MTFNGRRNARNGQSPNGRSPTRRIGLWGPSGSGKTAFLAAINIAIKQSQESQWLISGMNDESTRFLIEGTEMLETDRVFPDATEKTQRLSALMIRDEWQSGGLFRRRLSGREDFHLDLIDPPGGMQDARPTVPEGDQKPDDDYFEDSGEFEDDPLDDEGQVSEDQDPEELVNSLAACDGFLYLFDPITERAKGNARSNFQGTLLRITEKVVQSRERRMAGGKLPQYIAVCVTKLDDPRIYKTARAGALLTYDYGEYNFPQVPQEWAEEFFELLCTTPQLRGAAGVRGGIRTSFRRERVKYFATTSVGFYLAPRSLRFNERDYLNVSVGPDGRAMIRGDVYPINVLEPLLWLGGQIMSKRG
jgi:energy-coupling factor transporter ATP-binding protein EcfA2